MRTLILFFLFFVLLPRSAHAESSYDDLFPYYVQACTVTQAKPIGERPEAITGHTLIYIKGVCRNRGAPYPQLMVCPSHKNILDPESGVLVSVNSFTKNVNWIAVEGKSLGLYGRLEPSQTLTKEHFESLLREVLSDGTYSGVEIHEKDRKEDNDFPQPLPRPLPRSLVDSSEPDNVKLAKNSITYDFAVSIARDVYCNYVPINEKLTFLLIKKLNELNTRYFNSNKAHGIWHKEFNWSAIYNNCAHLVHNVFAELGFWRKLKVDQPFIFQLFNIAVPGNTFINIRNYISTLPKSPEEVYLNPRLRRIFQEFTWLPTPDGTIFEKIPFHQPNNLFESNLGLWFFEAPGSFAKEKEFKQIQSNPLLSDLALNLEMSIEHFKDILKEEKQSGSCPENDPRIKCGPFKTLSKKYFKYISTRLKETKLKLEKINRLK